MEEKSFEKSIGELETIVTQLEKGDLTLDEMLKLFEQGVGLSKSCSKMLDEAENQINILVKKDDGIEKQPFVSKNEV